MNNQKVIFITGASSGMGYELAKKLGQKGHIVYATARRLEKLQTLEPFGVIARKVDVTVQSEIDTVVSEIMTNHGRIDVAYCNAGYALYGPIEEPSSADIQKQFDINVFGVDRTIKAVLPHMKKAKAGRIIVTESMGAEIVFPYLGWYHATKFALRAVTTALREELNHINSNIKVIAIRPGGVKTEFSDVANTTINPNTQYPTFTTMLQKTDDMLAKAPADMGIKSTTNDLVHAGLASRPKKIYRTTPDSKILHKLYRIFDTEALATFLGNMLK